MEWLNEPANWQRTGDLVTVSVDTGTDFWRETGYGYVRDSGHVYGEVIAGDLDVSVRVRCILGVQYDQAGVMLRADERTWLKTGVEFFEGRPRLSTVLTLGRSSWMVTDLPAGTDDIVLRVSRRGDAVEVRYVIEDGPAELAALAFLPPGREVLAGVMGAAPEGPGFRVTFHDLRITERDWSAAPAGDDAGTGPADQAAWTSDDTPAWSPVTAEPSFTPRERDSGWTPRERDSGWTAAEDETPDWPASAAQADGPSWPVPAVTEDDADWPEPADEDDTDWPAALAAAVQDEPGWPAPAPGDAAADAGGPEPDTASVERSRDDPAAPGLTGPGPAAPETAPDRAGPDATEPGPAAQHEPAAEKLAGAESAGAEPAGPGPAGPAPGAHGPGSSAADGGLADGGPADRGPADRGPADRGPADRGPADGGAAGWPATADRDAAADWELLAAGAQAGHARRWIAQADDAEVATEWPGPPLPAAARNGLLAGKGRPGPAEWADDAQTGPGPPRPRPADPAATAPDVLDAGAAPDAGASGNGAPKHSAAGHSAAEDAASKDGAADDAASADRAAEDAASGDRATGDAASGDGAAEPGPAEPGPAEPEPSARESRRSRSKRTAADLPADPDAADEWIS